MFRGAGLAVCGKASVIPLSGIVKDVDDKCLLFVRCEGLGDRAKVDLDAVGAILDAHPAASLLEAGWCTTGQLILTVSIAALDPAARAALTDRVEAIESLLRKRPREDNDHDLRDSKRPRTE